MAAIHTAEVASDKCGSAAQKRGFACTVNYFRNRRILITIMVEEQTTSQTVIMVAVAPTPTGSF